MSVPLEFSPDARGQGLSSPKPTCADIGMYTEISFRLEI